MHIHVFCMSCFSLKIDQFIVFVCRLNILIMLFLFQCPKPVVVAVHGACVGGGRHHTDNITPLLIFEGKFSSTLKNFYLKSFICHCLAGGGLQISMIGIQTSCFLLLCYSMWGDGLLQPQK